MYRFCLIAVLCLFVDPVVPQDAETRGECDPLYVEIVNVDYSNYLFLTGLYVTANETCNGQEVYMRVGYNSRPRYLQYSSNDTWVIAYDVPCGDSSDTLEGSDCDTSSGGTDPTKCVTWREYYNDVWNEDTGLLCACTQPSCTTVLVQGVQCQFLSDGTYSVAPAHMWCSGRPVYRNDDCQFLSYAEDIAGWIIGANTCYNLGTIDVVNTQQVYPYNVPYVWQEYCQNGWADNYGLRVTCGTPPANGKMDPADLPAKLPAATPRAAPLITPLGRGPASRVIPPKGHVWDEL